MNLHKSINTLLVSLSGFSGASLASSLMESQPGSIYAAPAGTDMVIDSDRPTTQFVSPNKGSLSKIFPNFEIALLNESGKIALVTAEAPLVSIEECQSELKVGYDLISKHYPGFTNTPSSMSQIGGSNEFSKANEDVYFVYECSKGYVL